MKDIEQQKEDMLNRYLDSLDEQETYYCDECDKEMEQPYVIDNQNYWCSEECHSNWLGYDAEGNLITENK